MKPNLDFTSLNNFRSIFKLPFPSKILVKIVLIQLKSHLSSNCISVILKVLNYILLATDKGSVVALVLLELSSAFDMVDHNILIFWLESWSTRYCFKMVLFVFLLIFGSLFLLVSISLLLLLFCVVYCTSGLNSCTSLIFKRHGVSFHLYADNTQLYLPLQCNNKESSGPLLAWLQELQVWLNQNSNYLNWFQ